ncbi:MAG: ABC transporter substrate-binding protein [Termitinemataceae bacterium]|nr:MAG: ABC transporter substrate-binding protein [Termitinemataceae bacterium]
MRIVKRVIFCILTLCVIVSCTKKPNSVLPNLKDNFDFAHLFTDDDGNLIKFSAPYKRIIPLYSAHTENLFELGAGDSVIGGHKTCNYPAQADALPKYDYTGDPEYIISAAPDLVLIRPFIRKSRPDYIAEIEKAGIQVVSLYPETFDDFDLYIRNLAMLTDSKEAAEYKLHEFHAELEKISSNERSNKRYIKNVFFESTENEYRTAAAGSLPAIAIDIAGGINIAAYAKPLRGSSIAPFGDEKLFLQADKIDLYIVQDGAMNRTKNLEALQRRRGFMSIKAVREANVLFINEKIISSPTFRYIQGVQMIANALR